jgi:hypothetical protein
MTTRLIPWTSLASRQNRRWMRLSWHMLATALMTTLPMLVVSLVLVRQAAVGAQERAVAMLHARAVRVVQDSSRAIERAEQVLDFLSARVELKELDSAACHHLVEGVGSIDRLWANVGVVGADGRILCASRMPPDPRSVSLAGRPWFREVMASDQVVISAPNDGAIVGRPVLHVARALHDVQGRRVVAMLVSMDLMELSRRIDGAELPVGSAILLTDARDRIVARFPDPSIWIGVDARPSVTTFLARHPQGTGEATGLDNVSRLYAQAAGESPGWKAWVGVPVDIVRAPGRAALELALAGILASLALGILLAATLAWRNSRPLGATASG